MPRNTQARAHVNEKLAIPTFSSDSDTELSHHAGSESEEEDQVTEVATPLSRKEKRKLRKSISPEGDDVAAAEKISKSKAPPNNPPKNKNKQRNPQPSTDSLLSGATEGSMASSKYYPLLVCSIGNPGAQYAKSMHSAGHYIVSIIHSQSRGLYQPFAKGLSGLVSRPSTTHYKAGVIAGYTKNRSQEVRHSEQDDFTLWQSTSLMNVSGKGVKNAWTTFREEQRQRGLEARLVVVHDELESDLGKVSIKDGSASAKGHNGLKSIQASLGNTKWWRVAVGIGRPQSREPNVVSAFVLRKMTYAEETVLYKASAQALRACQDIADGTR